MEDNQPTTANNNADFDHIVVGNDIVIPVDSRNINGMVASLHTQDPTNGADFDAMIKRINAINGSMGVTGQHLGNRDSASLSKEMLGFNLLPEK